MKLTRDQVIDRMLFCKTAAEVEEARDVRDEWMKENPEDFGILDAGSSVEQMAQSLGLRTNQERLAAKRGSSATE